MPRIQDSGSNYSFFDKKVKANVKYSKFDLSYINTLTANEGQLIPVWVQHTLPGETYDISLQSLIRVVNPPVVPLMSRQRVFFHTYWCSYSQLWKSWQTFMRRGQSGKTLLSIPRLGFSTDVVDDVPSAWNRGKLLDYLGFPKPEFNTVRTAFVNALPLMAYLRIYRDYYKNANLDVDNVDWYPDNDEDFAILFNGDKVVGQTGTFLDNLTDPFRLRYRDYVDDYFTSARPWPQRGNAPTLDFDILFNNSFAVGLQTPEGLKQLFATGYFGSDNHFYQRLNNGNIFTNQPDTATTNGSRNVGGLSTYHTLGSDGHISNGEATIRGLFTLPSEDTFSVFSTITAEKFRRLFAESIIMEKMARTSGFYGEFITSFFNSDPKNALNFKPYYVGGTYCPIVYSEVLQTSEDGNTPLGTVGGRGISANKGFIGRFRTDDYGIFMTIMSIMPDVYYSQGVQRENLYQVQEDFYLPERAELGMQGIFKGEIYFTGDDEEDYDLWAYQDRYDELRYRANEVHGEVANVNNLSFSPYVQQRHFDSSPSFNQQFVNTEGNIDKSWLSAPDVRKFIWSRKPRLVYITFSINKLLIKTR